MSPPTGERKLKVLYVAPEVAPYRKTGGLADVAGVLPRAVRQRGVDIRVVMPLYQGIDWHSLERLEGTLGVPMYFGQARASVRLGRLPGSDLPVYFIEYNRFFDRPHLYGPPGQAYSDNLERFSFLSRAALELCKTIGFFPDVIHANDWQTALVPVYVNTVEWARPMHGAGTLFTIHNLAYQGNFESGAMFITGLGWEHYNSSEFEHFGDMNLMKAGIRHANLLSTVSPTYAREIQTSAYGFGLDGELALRGRDLRGVLNGIDAHAWDPEHDPHIAAPYGARDIAGKAVCKAALQQQLGLPVRPNVPIFGVVGRLTAQKGFDVLAHALEHILSWDVQIVLLGKGDHEAEHFFGYVASRRGEKMRAYIAFDEGLAHRIEAGSDFLLMPSRYEPCGLTQMYSQRYGTLPIVRGTGGLLDTVSNYNQANGEGTGFIFWDLTPGALADTVGWALSTYHDRPEHILAMRKRAMEQDFSWDRAAVAHEHLYREAYRIRRGHEFGAR
ncbi:MAG: glycogen synthase GlgA [Deltaproteobacteria bacterium]|nr:glycogen synthase GlgA [Deltaproteobacteria bacterium]